MQPDNPLVRKKKKVFAVYAKIFKTGVVEAHVVGNVHTCVHIYTDLVTC